MVSRRIVSSEETALVYGGRLFHAHAAATGNARSPRVDRQVDGTSIVGEYSIEYLLVINVFVFVTGLEEVYHRRRSTDVG